MEFEYADITYQLPDGELHKVQVTKLIVEGEWINYMRNGRRHWMNVARLVSISTHPEV